MGGTWAGWKCWWQTLEAGLWESIEMNGRFLWMHDGITIIIDDASPTPTHAHLGGKEKQSESEGEWNIWPSG